MKNTNFSRSHLLHGYPVTTAWWTNKPQQDQHTAADVKDTFKDELTHFLRNFSLHCYRWLVEPHISGWQRFVWLLVHVIAFLTIVRALQTAYTMYSVGSTTVTTLYDTLYPIQSVPFPAISICNNNRIGRSAAVEYARVLASKDVNHTQNPEYFLRQIREFGRLLDNDLNTGVELMAFQSFLDAFDSNGTYDTTYNMRRLTPSCESMLLRCIWRGVERPCLEPHTMFAARSTQYGFCCTFNYVRPDQLQQPEPPSYYIDDTGPERGLILLLNGASDDYFYPLYNFVGFVVQIFNPNEFPDVPSGSVSERLVALGYESFIRIDSNTLLTDKDTKRYSAEARGCLFSDDMVDDYGGRYKRSDCVVNCRIASIVALCGCQIYYLPISNVLLPQNRPGGKSVPTCTLEHLACLNRYRIKWATMLLKLDLVVGLEQELADGLYCPSCLPSCSDTQYVVSSQELPLLPTRRKRDTLMTGIRNVSDVALVRIYLGQPETWLYKQAVSTQWYEIVSLLGGTCGVISGFSLLTVAEVVVFVGRTLLRMVRDCVRTERGHGCLEHPDAVLYILP